MDVKKPNYVIFIKSIPSIITVIIFAFFFYILLGFFNFRDVIFGPPQLLPFLLVIIVVLFSIPFFLIVEALWKKSEIEFRIMEYIVRLGNIEDYFYLFNSSNYCRNGNDPDYNKREFVNFLSLITEFSGDPRLLKMKDNAFDLYVMRWINKAELMVYCRAIGMNEEQFEEESQKYISTYLSENAEWEEREGREREERERKEREQCQGS